MRVEVQLNMLDILKQTFFPPKTHTKKNTFSRVSLVKLTMSCCYLVPSVSNPDRKK